MSLAEVLAIIGVLSAIIGGPTLGVLIYRRQHRKEALQAEQKQAADNLDRAARAFDMYVKLTQDLDHWRAEQERMFRDERERWISERTVLQERIHSLEIQIADLKQRLNLEDRRNSHE